MKILSILFFAILASISVRAQDIYGTDDGKISFYSKTPVQDINPVSKQLAGAMNAKTKKVFFKVPMRSFVFQNSLMQEHFNENYVESDKYPNATFNGEIQGNDDLTKDGTYKVTVKGKLNIHNVDQERTIEGTITVKGGQITIHSEFMVKVADHKIAIP